MPWVLAGAVGVVCVPWVLAGAVGVVCVPWVLAGVVGVSRAVGACWCRGCFACRGKKKSLKVAQSRPKSPKTAY